MRIYTKKGDFGETDLLSKRVPKDDLRIDFNGTIDMCLSYISLSRQLIKDEKDIEILDAVYDHLSTISYEIVLDDGTGMISLKDIDYVEVKIDKNESSLPKLAGFVKFDKSIGAAVLNILRVNIRNAERKMVELSRKVRINPNSLKYLNRVSDLMFVLARKYNENIKG